MRSRPLEIAPARARNKKVESLWGDPNFIAEEKWDGWRFLMHFGSDLDRTFLTGRRVSKTTGELSEKGLCDPMLSPGSFYLQGLRYTVIDGEVMSPAGFRDIAGIMNVDPEKAAKRIAEIGPPRYNAFDLLFNDGEDVRGYSQLERRHMLAELMAHIDNQLITLTPIFKPDISVYDSIVDAGGEGVILKDISAEYGEGWIKVKRFSTLDVVVTGFTDAKHGVTGKYVGLIGAAVVSVFSSAGGMIEIGRVSGMTDDVRRDMSENPGRWIGTVIEVRAQGFGKDRLRHPRFKRHRQDADPKHATYLKMMADLDTQADPVQRKQLNFSFA